jgi:hypothetical protein
MTGVIIYVIYGIFSDKFLPGSYRRKNKRKRGASQLLLIALVSVTLQNAFCRSLHQAAY